MNPDVDGADEPDETLSRREQLITLLATYTSSELAGILAGSAFVDGGSVAILPCPTDPSDAWKARAAEYDPVAQARDDRYPGAAHWRRFCAVLAATGSIPFAAKQVGVTTYKIQRRRDRFPEFGEHVQQALDYFNHGVLERTAFVRAIDGVLEPVFNKGVIVGYVRRYSDALMNKLLEGNLDKYKSKTQVDVKTERRLVIEGGFNEDDRPAMLDITPSTDPALLEHTLDAAPASEDTPADELGGP